MEPIRIDVYLHNESSNTERKLDTILTAIQRIENKENEIMADLGPLTTSVQNNTTVIGSALTLIQGFSAQLAAAGTDPVALAALKTQIDNDDTQLAAAVAANTPAASQPAGPASAVAPVSR